MIRTLVCATAGAALLFAAGCSVQKPEGASTEKTAAAATTPYGANAAAGGTFVHDGVTLYYETYGEGEPLLLIHGNGGDIRSMSAQIEHFRKTRKVIAMDSRDQGKSGPSTGPMSYEKMADDLAALLDHLKVGPADVIGWSDGGIEALLLGERHPTKVRRLVAMAANLNPRAIYPETAAMVKEAQGQMTPEVLATPEGQRQNKLITLLATEPNIDPARLAKVTAPTLILSGDHDLILLSHTVQIYEALPNANLAVFPNSTHAAPYDDPALFNGTIDRFFATPFKAKDRVADMMASLQKMGEATPTPEPIAAPEKKSQ